METAALRVGQQTGRYDTLPLISKQTRVFSRNVPGYYGVTRSFFFAAMFVAPRCSLLVLYIITADSLYFGSAQLGTLEGGGAAGFKTRLLPVWIIMPSASQGQLKWKREPHFASHRKHKASRVSGVSWFIPSSWNRSTVSTAEEQTQMFAVVFKRWLLVHVVACCTLISTVLVGGIYLRNSWRITFRLLINKATIRVAARFVVFNAKRE